MRPSESRNRRRRECFGCGYRFTTYERLAIAPPELENRVIEALATAGNTIKKALNEN